MAIKSTQRKHEVAAHKIENLVVAYFGGKELFKQCVRGEHFVTKQYLQDGCKASLNVIYMDVNSEECVFIHARSGQVTVLSLDETRKLVKLYLCTPPRLFMRIFHWDVLGMFP